MAEVLGLCAGGGGTSIHWHQARIRQWHMEDRSERDWSTMGWPWSVVHGPWMLLMEKGGDNDLTSCEVEKARHFPPVTLIQACKKDGLYSSYLDS